MNNSQWITIVLITAVLMLVFLIFNSKKISMPQILTPDTETPINTPPPPPPENKEKTT